MLNLHDLLAENPHIQSEIDAIKQAAREDGAATERKLTEARTKGAMPVLTSAEFPEVLKAMALEVIEGTKDLATLTGSVAVFDSLKAVEVQTAVVADSADQPDVAPIVTPEKSTDGQLRTAADIDAEIRDIRGEAV